MTDPGHEYWRRQAVQLEVINALQELIDRVPDRYAGMSTVGSAELTVYVADPNAAHDDRFIALLDDARAASIQAAVAHSPRPLRTLRAIMNGIMSNDPGSEPGFRAIECWMDPPTATVRVLVADAAVDTVRRKLAHHGEAVVVLGNGPADPSTRLPRYGGSREGWPQPSLATGDAAGKRVDGVAELYRREGFTVELYYLGEPVGLTGDLRSDRIRLLVHDGRIVDATQA
jgi:hypothetical protein